MSKYKYILSSLIVVVIAVCLTACGDDKDEPEATYKANGRGLMANWDGSTEEYFFYISSDKVIMVSNVEDEWELRPYPNSFSKVLNNTNLYKDIRDALMYQFDIYPGSPLKITINDNTDWSEYPYSEIAGLADKMKTLKSQYKYYTYDGEGTFYVFNRIEGRPLFQY